MPNVVIWNIENMGANNIRRGNYNALFRFIAALVNAGNVEVLIIEEFKRACAVRIPNLVAMLGQNWRFDYLPGALSNNTRPNTSFGDLAYTTAANREGYAVVWRGNTLNPFANGMSFNGRPAGPNANQSYINLVTMGTDIDVDPNDTPPLTPNAANGVNFPLGFPIPACSNVRVQRRRTRQNGNNVAVHDLNNITNMTISRNPSVVQVSQAGGSVPVVAYHAPNGTYSSAYGALLSAMAGHLQGGGRAVAGGDFNVVNNGQVGWAFDNFTEVQHPFTDETADGNGVHARTTIKYVVNPWNNPALIARNATAANCVFEARDQVFCRPHMANAGVYDLIAKLNPNDPGHDANLANLVTQNGQIRAQVNRAINNNGLPAVVQGDPVARADLQNTFVNHAFPNYRTIAIFLKVFISDHLPLIVPV